MQGGPVVVPVGRVELALAPVPQRGLTDDASVLPAPPDLVLRFGTDLFELLAQAQADEDPAGVGRGLDSGTDLGQFGGLFQDGDVQTAAAQGQGGREASEAASGDGHFVGLTGRHPYSNRCESAVGYRGAVVLGSVF